MVVRNTRFTDESNRDRSKDPYIYYSRGGLFSRRDGAWEIAGGWAFESRNEIPIFKKYKVSRLALTKIALERKRIARVRG